jgi:hypothetical protein
MKQKKHLFEKLKKSLLLAHFTQNYTKIYMIYRIFKFDLLDFQGLNSPNFRKSILFEYKFKNRKPEISNPLCLLYSFYLFY